MQNNQIRSKCCLTLAKKDKQMIKPATPTACQAVVGTLATAYWQTCSRSVVYALTLAIAIASPSVQAFQPGQDLQVSDIKLRNQVMAALRDGTDSLKRKQSADGSWGPGEGDFSQFTIGLTSLSLLALINSDEPVDSPVIQDGLRFLRGRPPNEPTNVYESSLYVMALCAAGELEKDRFRIRREVSALEATQRTEGPLAGLWGYDIVGRGGRRSEDRSNGQFAVLALRDAAYAGFRVDRNVWLRTHEHWLEGQNRDGSWGYHPGESARGSMTTAGLSTLAITTRMLQDDRDVNAAGRPNCCEAHPLPTAFEKGREWMGDKFTVFANPGASGWHYYYLYGLERAARLGNVRFFGKHDWYREGARYLVKAQNADGSWTERGNSTPSLSSAFALLFLSKGLSRVVVNKLDYTSVGFEEDVNGEWNRHPLDIPNLIDKIDGLEGWPPRLTSQNLNLNRLNENIAVTDMNQAPVLYISGSKAPSLTDQHIKWLREYIDEGGFIFAVNNCGEGTFDEGFRDIVARMFPDGDATMHRLQADHPVYRSEYALPNAAGIELHGVDFGCRTTIIYSPVDLACLWQKWMRNDPPERSDALIQRIMRANRIGTNVLAYATGREPPVKLNESGQRKKAAPQDINRGLMEIAQIKHAGGWDTAPKALENLLAGLNQTVGMNASTKRRIVRVELEDLKRFPIAYMHGRYRFSLSNQERTALRDYLSRGAVLFADACCGSEQFDRSFRDLMLQLYPDNPMKRIPLDHEIFSDAVGRKIETLNVRKLVAGGANATLQKRTERIPPVLEGIEIDGRLSVIYSKYDISCALENQASLACDGYLEKDAMQLAINIILYAMLQEIGGPVPASQP